jgi:DNA invertase Pin-like site-specific DNA recombinase
MKTMIYGYGRVSTAAQDESGQVKQLKAAGCQKIFREKITGTTADARQADEEASPRRRGDHSGR